MCLHHYSCSLAVALERYDCNSSPEDRCDFVCDCQDCSDEQDCGKTLNVYIFIPSSIWLMYLCVLFLTFFLFSFIGWMLGYQGRDFMCDFEHEGKCGWTVQSDEGGYMWQRQQSGNTLPDSGPSSDYTTGTSTGTWLFVLPAGALYIYKAFPNPIIDLLNTNLNCILSCFSLTSWF